MQNLQQQMLQQELNDQDEVIMKYDLIGHTFYEISDSLKKRFMVLYSHFVKDELERFPIRKLIDSYREWIESFIYQKSMSIEQGTRLVEEVHEYRKLNYQKLFNQVVAQVKEVVRIFVRAMVFFYQFDFQAGETIDVLLTNLLTSIILKNPTYTKVIDLIKKAYKEDIR